jgi:wobble nucleotide-excising tRNase
MQERLLKFEQPYIHLQSGAKIPFRGRNMKLRIVRTKGNNVEVKGELLKVLSTGEQRALYILNIIFEVEARIKEGKEVLFVVDDIADSFDYKNKYAIIEYLKHMSEVSHFYMIILTHNFDFFRTIESRKISIYKQCLISLKNKDGVSLVKISGLKNPFIYDWKSHLSDKKKLVASIPFVRNLVEYMGDGELKELYISVKTHLT